MTIKEWNRAYRVTFAISLGEGNGFSRASLVLCNRHLEVFRETRTIKLTGETFAPELCDHCEAEAEKKPVKPFMLYAEDHRRA